MTRSHPWSRFVAVGDSFTEGLEDPEPRCPGGYRGWADRVAEVLSAATEDFAYANLAIRGRLLKQIFDEQVEAALELHPDLVSICAGGNDLIRPGADPDELAVLFDAAVARLGSGGATVVMFTGPDMGDTPVLGRSRAKVAIYNENLRGIALRHDAIVADLWSMLELRDPRAFAADRLHFSPVGHHAIARMVLAALNVASELEPFVPTELPTRSWREARADDFEWAREYLVPWVLRRINHQSSAASLRAKRPEPGRVIRSEE